MTFNSSACVLWRRKHVQAVTGLSRSSVYVRISEGLLPRPVPIGARAVGWPQAEIEAINRARIAGRDDDEIRALVLGLVESRRTPEGQR